MLGRKACGAGATYCDNRRILKRVTEVRDSPEELCGTLQDERAGSHEEEKKQREWRESRKGGRERVSSPHLRKWTAKERRAARACEGERVRWWRSRR